MRKLVYVPIIHTGSDMGSMRDELENKTASLLGQEQWKKHVNTVNAYWESIVYYFNHLDYTVKGLKLYQDGMFAEGDAAMKIIDAGIEAGSKNSEIVLNLIMRGGILVKTEDYALVKNEYDGIQSLLRSVNSARLLYNLLRYKISKASNLRKRDTFIAGRISDTLRVNETGILFIGAYHNIASLLPKDIEVSEVKKIEKIRAYQKLIQSGPGKKPRLFEELSLYLSGKQFG
ncbi:MAG: hypothetical protein WCO02_11225 [Bacteroidota bacterium]